MKQNITVGKHGSLCTAGGGPEKLSQKGSAQRMPGESFSQASSWPPLGAGTAVFYRSTMLAGPACTSQAVGLVYQPCNKPGNPEIILPCLLYL